MSEIVVLMTVSSEEEATKISSVLVEDGLVACVNIVPGIQSIFKWEGKVEKETEYLLVAKTVRDAFQPLIETVKALHSYEVPEIIGLPVQGGNQDYLSWVKEMTRNPKSPLSGA